LLDRRSYIEILQRVHIRVSEFHIELALLISKNSLFFVDIINSKITAAATQRVNMSKSRPKSLSLWHQQLAYLGIQAVKRLQELVESMKISKIKIQNSNFIFAKSLYIAL